MFYQPQNKPDQYYSFGQYLRLGKSKVSKDTSILIDNFIEKVPAEELETAISMMSANIHGIAIDKGNNRTRRCEENTYRTRIAASNENYMEYIKSFSTTKMSYEVLPSVQAHISGKENFTIYLDPRDEPKYNIDGQKLTYEEVLLKFMSSCSNVGVDIEVKNPDMNTRIASLISKKSIPEVVSGKDFLTEEEIDEANGVLQAISEMEVVPLAKSYAPIDNALNHVDGIRIQTQEGPSVIPMTSALFHVGIDKYNTIDNGRIGPLYYDCLKLNSDLNNEERLEYVRSILDFDPTMINSDYDLLQKSKYLYFNVAWLNGPHFTPLQKEHLRWYWLMLIPGTADYVLQRLQSPLNIWNNPSDVAHYVKFIRRIAGYYSLYKQMHPKKPSEFIIEFLAKNKYPKSANMIIPAFNLYSRIVQIRINVSGRNKKYGGSIFGLGSQVLKAMEEAVIDIGGPVVHTVGDISDFDAYDVEEIKSRDAVIQENLVAHNSSRINTKVKVDIDEKEIKRDVVSDSVDEYSNEEDINGWDLDVKVNDSYDEESQDSRKSDSSRRDKVRSGEDSYTKNNFRGFQTKKYVDGSGTFGDVKSSSFYSGDNSGVRKLHYGINSNVKDNNSSNSIDRVDKSTVRSYGLGSGREVSPVRGKVNSKSAVSMRQLLSVIGDDIQGTSD